MTARNKLGLVMMMLAALIVVCFFAGVYAALLTSWTVPHDTKDHGHTFGFWFITTALTIVLSCVLGEFGNDLFNEKVKK